MRLALKCLALLALCALAAAARPAAAQSGGVSYSNWSLSGNLMILRFLLPVADARRLVGSDIPIETQAKVGDYLLDHLAVRSADGDCPAIDQGFDIGRVDPLSVQPGMYGFEIFFRCTDPRGLVLQDTALFDRLPGEVSFARVDLGGQLSQQLFTAGHEQVRVPATRPLRSAGIGRYLGLGVAHILGGLDRLCFLLGSLLLLRRPRQVRHLIAGLSLGYTASLLIALGGWITPRMTLLGAFIGFMVAFLSAQLLTRQTGKPRILALGSAGLLLWLAAVVLLAHGNLTVVLLAGAALFAGCYLAISDRFEQHLLGCLLVPALFGFLDGFVLPAALLPQPPSRRALLPMLLGFDVGAVLVDALLLLAVMGGALWLLRWRRLPTLKALVTDIAAAGLGGLGIFWMLSRLHG
ncbi:MAG TPA: HupE/UreJ family protein [Steroidobacteraceae bacterium]|nr:HupE/UreJ family protein [Steroidobacteraceae bacterium]